MRTLATSACLALVGLIASCRASDSVGLGPQVAPGVRVEIDGASTFPADQLREVAKFEIASFSVGDHPRAALDDAAFMTERFYRSQGFAQVEVRYEIEDSAAGRVGRLIVSEGVRTVVDELTFPDATSMPGDELAALYEAPEIDGKEAFNESSLARLVDEVRTRYVDAGFLRVEVREPALVFSKDRGEVDVAVAIVEGEPFRVRSVIFVDAPERAVEELTQLGGRHQDKVYVASTPRALRSETIEILGREGFPDASARVHEQVAEQADVLDVRVDIQAGDRVEIAEVVVRGARRVDEQLVRSRIELRAGERYDVEKERKSLRELYRSGLFSSVELRLEGQGPKRTLAVIVTETSSRELFVEPGYGSYERLRLVLGWRDKNLFGSGRVFDFEGSLSELAQRATVSLSDLHLFESDIESSITLFGGEREEPSFTSNEFGGTWSFTRHFLRDVEGRRIQAILAYELRRSGISDVDANAPPEDTDDFDISSFTLTPSYDSRDIFFVPTRGAFVQTSVEYASSVIASELDYVRARWTASRFESIDERTVLAVSWRGGLIAPFGGTDSIPLQERFFNGGENTVRAFREDQIGPEDAQGEPVGGNAFNVWTAELRRRLRGNLEGALFLDVGNVLAEHNDALDLVGLREGVGVGIRYLLPVGPIRLDLGYNPDPKAGESDLVLHLSVGMSF